MQMESPLSAGCNKCQQYKQRYSALKAKVVAFELKAVQCKVAKRSKIEQQQTQIAAIQSASNFISRQLQQHLLYQQHNQQVARKTLNDPSLAHFINPHQNYVQQLCEIISGLKDQVARVKQEQLKVMESIHQSMQRLSLQFSIKKAAEQDFALTARIAAYKLKCQTLAKQNDGFKELFEILEDSVPPGTDLRQFVRKHRDDLLLCAGTGISPSLKLCLDQLTHGIESSRQVLAQLQSKLSCDQQGQMSFKRLLATLVQEVVEPMVERERVWVQTVGELGGKQMPRTGQGQQQSQVLRQEREEQERRLADKWDTETQLEQSQQEEWQGRFVELKGKMKKYEQIIRNYIARFQTMQSEIEELRGDNDLLHCKLSLRESSLT